MARKPERAVAEEVIGGFLAERRLFSCAMAHNVQGRPAGRILHNRWLTSGSGGGQFDGADEK